jgi:phage shock protein C
MKKLYRSQKQKIVAGVCGGIAEYFEIDPVLIRLIWIVLIVFGGTGVLAYLIAWIIIPQENGTYESKTSSGESPAAPPVEVTVKKPSESTQSMRLFWGIVLILIGLLIVAHQFWWPLDFFRMMCRNIFKYFIPALLIVLGVFIIIQGSGQSKNKNN